MTFIEIQCNPAFGYNLIYFLGIINADLEWKLLEAFFNWRLICKNPIRAHVNFILPIFISIDPNSFSHFNLIKSWVDPNIYLNDLVKPIVNWCKKLSKLNLSQSLVEYKFPE